MYFIIFFFVILVSFFLVKEYHCSNNQKAALKKMAPLAVVIPVLFLTFILSGFEHIILLILFGVCNVFCLSCIKAFAKKSNWFIVLMLPATYLLFFILITFNKPVYYGAMDGFAAAVDGYVMMLIFPTYPVFIFSLSMLMCRDWVKGTLMIVFAVISGILGVCQSIGREGYLADDGGGAFAVIILMLIVIGMFYLQKYKIFERIIASKQHIINR